MKKIFALFAFAALAAACAKESDLSDRTPSGNVPEGNIMMLRADIPAMEAKADAVGSFAWAEGDAIAIPVEGGYVDFIYDSAKEAFTYALTGNETFIDGTAYYPASSRPEGGYSTDFASPEAAKAGFKMEAPFTKGCEKLTFTHKSSLIKLSFTGVPATATGVRVKAGETTVATVALAGQSGNVDVFVPLTPDGSKDYYFALMQNAIALKEVHKSAVSLAAGTYYTSPSIDFAISELYLIGGATDYSWSIAAMPALEKEGSVFSIKANLTAGAPNTNELFRFPMQQVADAWWPCLVAGDTEGTVRIGDSDYDAGRQFYVSQDGYYDISIDVSAMTYTITRLGDKVNRPEIVNLYAMGDATDASWTATAGLPFTKEGDVFTLNANLYSGRSFRLQTQIVDWWPSLVKESATGGVVYCASQSDWDAHATVWEHFSVAESGYYEVVFDASTWNLTITRKGNVHEDPLDISELYLIGAAADIGWDIPSMPQFTKTGNVFTLTAHLKENAIFRFLTQKVADTWYPAVVKGETEGSVKLSNNAPDSEHFTVSEDGVYLITVDADARTVTFELLAADIWYIIGNVYGDDPSAGAWVNDFALTRSGSVWSITINITGEFKFRYYNSYTPEEERWNNNLGLWSAGSLGNDDWYGLLANSNNTNIGIKEAGRYSLTLEPSNNNMLHLTKVD